jgi:isovaleryl-CoA dehydrogenase
MAHLPGLAFDLGETITMLRDSVQQFADDEIAPRAADIDRDNLFPADLWKKLGSPRPARHDREGGVRRQRSRLPGAHRRHGGGVARLGLGGLSYGAHSNLAVNQLHRNGSEAQKKRYLPKLVSASTSARWR